MYKFHLKTFSWNIFCFVRNNLQQVIDLHLQSLLKIQKCIYSFICTFDSPIATTRKPRAPRASPRKAKLCYMHILYCRCTFLMSSSIIPKYYKWCRQQCHYATLPKSQAKDALSIKSNMFIFWQKILAKWFNYILWFA